MLSGSVRQERPTGRWVVRRVGCPSMSAGFARMLAPHAEADHGQNFEPFEGDGGVASLALSKAADFDPVQGCFDVGQRSYRCGSDGEGYLVPRIIPAGDGH